MDDEGTVRLRISELGDWRYEFLVALHEWIESQLLRFRSGEESPKLLTKIVDDFDNEFEFTRNDPERRRRVLDHPQDYPRSVRAIAKLLEADLDAEPGDCRGAPYYHEHQLATGIERMLAPLLGVDWNEYEKRLEEVLNVGPQTS